MVIWTDNAISHITDSKNISKSLHCFYRKSNYNYIIRYEEVF